MRGKSGFRVRKQQSTVMGCKRRVWEAKNISTYEEVDRTPEVRPDRERGGWGMVVVKTILKNTQKIKL